MGNAVTRRTSGTQIKAGQVKPGQVKPGQVKPGQFKPGQSGNPAGRPRGAKSKLVDVFLKALLEDFDENGKDAIRKARDRSPVQYLRLIGTMVPKSWIDEDDEEELAPVPVIVVKPRHEMVRSPHALR